MIGISIAVKLEWEATLKYFNKKLDECEAFPFGEYFIRKILNTDVIFYRCGVRKVCSSASTQYMIDKFHLERIIVTGTCAGIDDTYENLDILIPNKAVQYDCTVKETEPLIKESFNVEIDLSKLLFDFNKGVIGTADKPVAMWKDYLELKNNDISIADTEAAGIAYVCKMNDVECLIIKGISDFPTNEEESNKEKSHKEQLNTYIDNIPKIMNKIFDEYIERCI
jgi:nucleoside phosphorylase